MKRYDNVLNKKHARRHEQAKCQLTSPRIWALECQKVSRPSLVSNLNICNLQSLSSGLPISQSVSSTWAIKQLAANPLDISLAISIGVVIHFFPSLIAPSGKVTLKDMEQWFRVRIHKRYQASKQQLQRHDPKQRFRVRIHQRYQASKQQLVQQKLRTVSSSISWCHMNFIS